ncbi:tetratricopeptide repeat protein [Hydrogenophaga sp. RWCD_12]|uniref:tetratricopeptide repeat protein n=1 Tax=Hydrogenophaga sp. RWCD_12 TaxID=3391190 RepID=UPI003984D5FC
MARFAKLDRRAVGVLLTVAMVVGGGAWIAHWPATHAPQLLTPGDVAPASEATPPDELHRRFDEAVVLLHARQHAKAVQALERVFELAPDMPEAHVNLGFALLGLEQPAEARRAFERAIDLRPNQANAYYGLALSHEAAHDLELAMGAMRSYLHLARHESESHLAKARSALWEWESQLRPQPASTPAPKGP